MLNRPTTVRRVLIYLAVIIGILVVGEIDYYTDSNIRVFSLYFIPLALAGWQLGRTGAVIASLLTTLVWLAALYVEDTYHVLPYIWLVNFFTQGIAFLTVALLIARLSEVTEKASQHARTDALTGLNNRLAFIEAANIALTLCKRHVRPVALVYFDLDNFKQVNDTHGHTQGDNMLRKCATILLEQTRETDVAARLGGDEFVIFLPETSHQEGFSFCERLQQAFESSPDFNAVGVTASMGLIVEATAQSDINQLLHLADARMYQAKRAGKNGIAANLT